MPIAEGPNKPKELGTTGAVPLIHVVTSQLSGPTFSPMTKCESRSQDLLNAEPTLEDEGSASMEGLDERALKTEGAGRKASGALKRYQLDAKPVLKRMRSQEQERE